MPSGQVTLEVTTSNLTPRADNMPSLTRVREILGANATVPTARGGSVLTAKRVCEPSMGKCWVCGAPCSGTVCDNCNKGPEVTPATSVDTCAPSMGCPMGGACVEDPIDQARVDQCPEC